MNANGSEVMVYAGDASNIYWIDQKGSADEESAVIEHISKEIIQGSISIFDYEETRLSVIKVGENYYCRNVPLSSIPLDEEVTE